MSPKPNELSTYQQALRYAHHPKIMNQLLTRHKQEQAAKEAAVKKKQQQKP